MQEPYGAYTWYPVNDQPADKALYDFTISAPAPWVGIANGALTDRTEEDGRTVTTWHADEPMSSYLTTVAIGDYDLEEQQTASGTPISLWVPKDKPRRRAKVRFAREALEWVEGKLGPYPFSTAGVLVTDSQSGMETQTHDHARRQRLRPLQAGARARARAPVVRRPDRPDRLARRLDERGHDDVPPGALGGRAGRHLARRADGRVRRVRQLPRASRRARRAPTTPTPSGRATSTTSPR